MAKRNSQKNFPCHCVWSWLHRRTYLCTFCTRSFSESGWKFPPGARWPPSWCTRPLPRVRGGCAGRLGRVCTIASTLVSNPGPAPPPCTLQPLPSFLLNNDAIAQNLTLHSSYPVWCSSKAELLPTVITTRSSPLQPMMMSPQKTTPVLTLTG